MNSTNRALNRLGVFVFGLVLLVVGGAVAAASAMPAWFDGWKTGAASAQHGVESTIASTQLGGLQQTWLLIAVPVVAVLLIILLLAFVFRQGRGRTRVLVSEKASGKAVHGSVVIDGKVAEQAIREALDQHPGIVSSTVSTFLVRKVSTLGITADVRRGVSPREIRSYIDTVISSWDTVFGEEVPVVIQIRSGLATRLAKSSRFAGRPAEDVQPVRAH